MMRIAILNLTGGGMSGGYKKYIRNILPRIALFDNVKSILCASPENFHLEELIGQIPKVQYVNCIPFKILGFKKNYNLIGKLDKFKPDVIFIPLERYFKYKDVSVVNMLRNMLPFTHVENNPLLERITTYFKKLVAQKATKSSNRVIAVSEYVRDFIKDELGISEKRIGLVYHGIDQSTVSEGQRPSIIPEGFNENFIFTTGSIDPYRGLEDIILALKELNAEKNDMKLVIAGEARSSLLQYKEKLNTLIIKGGLGDRVIWAGYLNEKQMSWCYSKSLLTVMASRTEACPNIALEMMRNGCLSIAAKNPPLPEIFSDCAYFYIPKDPRSLADAIKHVLTLSNEKKMEIQDNARKRVKDFSWVKSAERLILELETAMKNSF